MASNGKKGSGNAAPTQNEQKKPTTQVDQKNDAEQNETAQQPIPEIRVKIDKLFDDDTKKLKAFASANIGPFAVHGIRVFENEKGMFVNMPSVSYKDAQGNSLFKSDKWNAINRYSSIIYSGSTYSFTVLLTVTKVTEVA